MIGLPRKRDGKGILPSYDVQRFRFLAIYLAQSARWQ
jgi:hypothetical protein